MPSPCQTWYKIFTSVSLIAYSWVFNLSFICLYPIFICRFVIIYMFAIFRAIAGAILLLVCLFVTIQRYMHTLFLYPSSSGCKITQLKRKTKEIRMVNLKFQMQDFALFFLPSSRMLVSVKTHWLVYINNVSFHKKHIFSFLFLSTAELVHICFS